ncbi:MAG: adenosylcobinamide-GDP ribazoletransferase [Thermoleophilia bacterium]|nr:adenosylcobinamide-GDP ribazoletransferase [Thermoleophilia bacterium]
MIKPFFSALRFLTPVPVPESWAGGEKELSRSPYYFPVVGLLAGGVVAAVCFGFDQILPSLASSAILVCVLIAVSRALHMDGLADTADGLLSSRPREQTLAIMRDSRTGAMGVVAVVCVIVLKTALFTSVAPEGMRWKIALLMPVAGRCAMVMSMAVFRYARPEGGLATVFAVSGVWRWLLLAWAIVVALAAGWLIAGLTGLVAGAASAGVGLLLGLYCHRRIGGYTGDTLGATNEIVECVPALVGALWAWD